jgi:hypothetical protein
MVVPAGCGPLAPLLSPADWAAATFGAAQLGDPRRTRRLVATAAALAAHPERSLPHQLGDPAALKAAYRLFASRAVTFDQIIAPHQTQTRAACAAAAVTLLVQDTTELDFTAHRATTDLAPIGNGGGRGFHLQTVLAVTPAPRLPLGVLAAVPWRRPPVPRPAAARAARPRESDIWSRLVRTVGPPPAGRRWVHVADRGADCYRFFAACRQSGTDVLARVVQNRRVLHDAMPGRLIATVRAQPAAAARPLALPARAGRAARTAEVAVSWAALTLQPPAHAPRGQPALEPIACWAVRVWEPAPPSGVAPLEWLLVTTVPVATVDDAWERRDWYTARWVIEDLHQCLKSGCRVEAAQLRRCASLWRRLGILLPLAVRLLRLRETARALPDAPATAVADPRLIRLVAARTRQPTAATVAAFTAQVARLGGHQGRTRDGPPGWRTLWRGWWEVETLWAGARLAADVRAS